MSPIWRFISNYNSILLLQLMLMLLLLIHQQLAVVQFISGTFLAHEGLDKSTRLKLLLLVVNMLLLLVVVLKDLLLLLELLLLLLLVVLQVMVGWMVVLEVVGMLVLVVQMLRLLLGLFDSGVAGGVSWGRSCRQQACVAVQWEVS